MESAMVSLFGGTVSSMTAPSTGAAAPADSRQTASSKVSQATADLNALIAEAAKDLADYEHLTAEGKLGGAGQKLEELKRAIENLNTRQR